MCDTEESATPIPEPSPGNPCQDLDSNLRRAAKKIRKAKERKKSAGQILETFLLS